MISLVGTLMHILMRLVVLILHLGLEDSYGQLISHHLGMSAIHALDFSCTQ